MGMFKYEEDLGMWGRKEETIPNTFNCWYSSLLHTLLLWSKNGRRIVIRVERVEVETLSTDEPRS